MKHLLFVLAIVVLVGCSDWHDDVDHGYTYEEVVTYDLVIEASRRHYETYYLTIVGYEEGSGDPVCVVTLEYVEYYYDGYFQWVNIYGALENISGLEATFDFDVDGADWAYLSSAYRIEPGVIYDLGWIASSDYPAFTTSVDVTVYAPVIYYGPVANG